MAENKIAVFVEGQGELVFFRNILFHLLSDVSFSFECMKLHSGKTYDVPFIYKNPDAIIHFMIINVQNDTKVLSAIKEREQGLLQKGYSKIIGLRDMYSRVYRKYSTDISEELNNKFIRNAESIIQSMSDPEKVSFHFSIMEIETWWLSMYSIFEKINSSLTIDYINENLGFRLDDIDSEKYFFHPAVVLDEILQLVGSSYGKKLHDVESITNRIDIGDIQNAVLNDRCNSFRSFIDEIRSFV